MATLEEVGAALQAAHEKALQGDPEAAQHAQMFADEYRRMSAGLPPVETNPEPGIKQGVYEGLKNTGQKLYGGVRQIGNEVSGMLTMNPQTGERTPENLADKALIDQKMQEQKARFEPWQESHPVATAIGGALPYAAVPQSAGFTGNALLAGTMGGLEYGDPMVRGYNAATGVGAGLIGQGAAKLAGGLVNPIARNATTPYEKQVLAAALKLGVKPRLSQITGSKELAAMEDTAAQSQGGVGTMGNFQRGNNLALNATANRSIGQDYNNLSPDVMRNAATDIGGVFDTIKNLPNVKGVPPIQVSPKISDIADEILTQQNGLLASQRDPQLIKDATQAKYLAQNRAKLTGAQYQDNRSALSNASYNSENPAARQAYGKLVSALDDSAENSLRANGMHDLATDLKMARPEYANLKLLERGNVIRNADLQPLALANALKAKDPAAFRENPIGQNPMIDIARYGESFPPLVQGSQTYPRLQRSEIANSLTQAPYWRAVAGMTTNPYITAYINAAGDTVPARMAEALAAPAARVGAMGAADLAKDRIYKYNF